MAKTRKSHLGAWYILAGISGTNLLLDFQLLKAGFDWRFIALVGGISGLLAIAIHYFLHQKVMQASKGKALNLLAIVVACMGLAPIGPGWWPQLGGVAYAVFPTVGIGLVFLMRKAGRSLLLPTTVVIAGSLLLVLVLGFGEPGFIDLIEKRHLPTATAYMDEVMDIPMVRFSALKDGKGKHKALQYRIIAPAMDQLERATPWEVLASQTHPVMVAGSNLNPDLIDLRKGYKPIWVELAKPSGDSLWVAPRIALFPLSPAPAFKAPTWVQGLPWLLLRTLILVILLLPIPTARSLWAIPLVSGASALFAPLMVAYAIQFFPHLLTSEQVPLSLSEWLQSNHHLGINGLVTGLLLVAAIGLGTRAYPTNNSTARKP